MKKIFLIIAVVAVAMVVGIDFGHAQTSSSDNAQGGWYCPWMSGAQAGQGGWNCPRYGGGRGMHRRGYCMLQGGVGPGSVTPTPGKALTEEEAKTLVENYLKNTNNPNLKLGPVTSQEGVYEAQIVTKDGSLVDKIQVNKATGWFRSVY